MKGRPVRRGPGAAQQTRRTHQQITSTYRQDEMIGCGVCAEKSEHRFVFHERLLSPATRDNEKIERRRLGKGCISSKDESFSITDGAVSFHMM